MRTFLLTLMNDKNRIQPPDRDRILPPDDERILMQDKNRIQPPGKDRRPWRRLAESALEQIFPRRCPVCGEIVMPRGDKICPSCRDAFHFITEPVCKICGRELYADDQELCHNCGKHRFSFDYGIALMDYNDAAARSLGAVKYKGRREYLDYYAEETVLRLGKHLQEMQIDAFVPIPVHPARKRRRGYNQAAVLADRLGEALGIPVLEGALKRRKNTKALKELSAAERLKNLMDAFYPGDIPGNLKSVCIVDDIFTTGSTMEACSRILKRAGVEHVVCFSLCIRSDY